MKDLDQFNSFFNSALTPQLMKLELRRTQMKEMGIRVLFIAISVIVVCWALVFMEIIAWYFIPVVLLLTPALAYLYYKSNYYDNKIPHDFKAVSVSQIVKFADPSLIYEAEKFIPFKHFRNSELYMLTPDHYTGDDYIKGKIDGMPMMMSELLVQYESADKNESKKKNNWHTIFKGLFLVIQLPHAIQSKTFVLSSNLSKKLGHTGRLIEEGESLRGKYVTQYDHVAHPNRKFRDNFVVYSENPIIGERIITDRFKEEMLELKRNTNAAVHLSLIENKIYVAIERKKDFFEIDMKKSLLDGSYIGSFYKDLYYVFSIIQNLDVGDMLYQPVEKSEGEEEDPDFI